VSIAAWAVAAFDMAVPALDEAAFAVD